EGLRHPDARQNLLHRCPPAVHHSGSGCDSGYAERSHCGAGPPRRTSAKARLLRPAVSEPVCPLIRHKAECGKRIRLCFCKKGLQIAFFCATITRIVKSNDWAALYWLCPTQRKRDGV